MRITSDEPLDRLIGARSTPRVLIWTSSDELIAVLIDMISRRTLATATSEAEPDVARGAADAADGGGDDGRDDDDYDGRDDDNDDGPIDALDERGETALTRAARAGALPLVRALLAATPRGADADGGGGVAARACERFFARTADEVNVM